MHTFVSIARLSDLAEVWTHYSNIKFSLISLNYTLNFAVVGGFDCLPSVFRNEGIHQQANETRSVKYQCSLWAIYPEELWQECFCACYELPLLLHIKLIVNSDTSIPPKSLWIFCRVGPWTSQRGKNHRFSPIHGVSFGKKFSLWYVFLQNIATTVDLRVGVQSEEADARDLGQGHVVQGHGLVRGHRLEVEGQG